MGPGLRRDCRESGSPQRGLTLGSAMMGRAGENTMTQAARFRELLRRDGMVVAPGAYDCITARLIERAGFEAVYMTGAGTAATLGYPDFGIVTMSEMVENGGRVAGAVGPPGLADAR